MNERYVAKMSEVVKLCKENAALRRQVEELRQACQGLLELVEDNIATARDLHEVHMARAALARQEVTE